MRSRLTAGSSIVTWTARPSIIAPIARAAFSAESVANSTVLRPASITSVKQGAPAALDLPLRFPHRLVVQRPRPELEPERPVGVLGADLEELAKLGGGAVEALEPLGDELVEQALVLMERRRQQLVLGAEPVEDGGELVSARSATSAIRVLARPRSAITSAAAARIWGRLT